MAWEDIGNKPTVSILKFHDCPACKEAIFAAQGATFTPLAVIFKWCCDLCGHQFETVEPVEEAVV